MEASRNIEGPSMEFILNCYIEQRGRQWEAICTEFDLAAQGNTFQEAKTSLEKMICEYIEYVESLPESERQAFYNRRTPLHTRLTLALGVIFTAIFSRPHKGGDHRNVYTLPCAT